MVLGHLITERARLQLPCGGSAGRTRVAECSAPQDAGNTLSRRGKSVRPRPVKCLAAAGGTLGAKVGRLATPP